MELSFGQRISGLTADGAELQAAVFDENQVRAAAGLTMVLGAVAFSYAYFDAQYIPLQAVSTLFFVEFLARLTFGLRYSPMGVIARVMTLRQAPDWVSAKPKRFAWTLGLGMALLDDGHHQQRHPRHAASDDLRHLPDADVDGVGPRRVPGLQDPRACWCAAAGRPRTPRSRSALTASASSERRWRRDARDARSAPDWTEAEAAFRDANPAFARDGDPRRAPRHRVRTPRRRRRRLPRLHRREPVRGVAGRGAPPDAARRRLRQPALRQPDLVGRNRARRAGARGGAALLQRARERVRVHLHAERHRRAAARRRGLSVRPDAVPRHLRQPQLGQRHPRVRPREGSRDGVRAGRGARSARGRRLADHLDDGRAAHQPLRLSRAVQLLRRQAPARMDRPGPRAGLGRAPGLRRVRADEPARPVDVAAGLRRGVVLQDVRLPDRRWAR